jgi:hypothetical protein
MIYVHVYMFVFSFLFPVEPFIWGPLSFSPVWGGNRWLPNGVSSTRFFSIDGEIGYTNKIPSNLLEFIL